MGKPTGFLEFPRQTAPKRPIPLRKSDFLEVYEPMDPEALRAQGARCMDCGVPFCHQGCPLGNLIPDWNDLVYKDQWKAALDRLHATNNFPEFTGKLCPAPCEEACVLALIDKPVAIKQVEAALAERGWEEDWIVPQPSPVRTGKRVAVVGSGPAGLAAAQQLARVGHDVVVLERDDRLGGLLRYGIPDFKMEKKHIDRRIAQMQAEGVKFVTGAEIGSDAWPVRRLLSEFDAVCLAAGALQARDLDAPGRHLQGIYQAMDFLTRQNRQVSGDPVELISAKDKHVVIIGGGDTAADCLGTVHRQGCRDVRQFDIYPELPAERQVEENPWPQWAYVARTTPAHEEGGERIHARQVVRFLGDDFGRVRAIDTVEVRPTFSRITGPAGPKRFEVVPGSERTFPADLVLLAIGFVGTERPAGGLVDQLGLAIDARGNVVVDPFTHATSVPKVFACGDMTRGASLIVWAIAEGRQAAAGIDAFLMGQTDLPQPLAHGNHARPFV